MKGKIGNTEVNFVEEQTIKKVYKSDKGYISIELINGERYELFHGFFKKKYFIYFKQDGELYIIENEEDKNLILEFIKKIEVE